MRDGDLDKTMYIVGGEGNVRLSLIRRVFTSS